MRIFYFEVFGGEGGHTGMVDMLFTLLFCLFGVVVVRMDDLAEKSLLLFSEYSTIPLVTRENEQGSECYG